MPLQEPTLTKLLPAYTWEGGTNMYNKPVLQAYLDAGPQSWVMAGINLHLRAEQREFGKGKDIWPYCRAMQTVTGLV